MTDQNIVVIGAGMAGLTAAAYLSRAGLQVDVFEQHSLPGGYVSSFVRQGYTFPAGPTSFVSNGIVFPILKELGLEDKRRFVRVGQQISWDAQDIPLRDSRQVCRDLSSHFPDQRRGLQRYFRWVEAGSSGFRDMFDSRMMFGKDVLATLLRLGVRHPLFVWASAAAGRHTNRSLHAQYFQKGLLRQMLDQLGYPVMSGQNTLGLWTTYFYDTWTLVGGMQSFANLLVRFIREHGGRVRLGQGVERILIRDGAAVGVRLRDGSEIPAGRVVSAADLRHTCLDLIGSQHLSPVLDAKLQNAAPSESVFTVFLGLRDSPQLAAQLQRFQESHVWFVAPDGTYIQLVLLSKDDPSIAPPGRHALFLAMLDPYERWEPLKGNTAAYQECKQAAAEQLLARAETFLPGLRAHIEVQEAASPLTYERYTSNWRGGTSGWSWDPAKKPQISLAKDLPVENFYAVGHYVHSPGGVPTAMITAWYIAREILDRLAV